MAEKFLITKKSDCYDGFYERSFNSLNALKDHHKGFKFLNRQIKDKKIKNIKTMIRERSEDYYYYYECTVTVLPWLSCSLSKTSA